MARRKYLNILGRKCFIKEVDDLGEFHALFHSKKFEIEIEKKAETIILLHEAIHATITRIAFHIDEHLEEILVTAIENVIADNFEVCLKKLDKDK